MSEAIVWSGDGWATVDGIPVRCDRVRALGASPVWLVMNGYEHDDSVCVEHMTDRDLAARAVVAAVNVLRGEASPDVSAAVAAERERCLAWVQSATCSCGEPGCDGPHFDERFCRVHNGIRSGAPAPREG